MVASSSAAFRVVLAVFWLQVALIPSYAQPPGDPPDSSRDAGELLYNGIRLPAKWPPAFDQVIRGEADLPPRMPDPPYLENPPDVIPIDVGRQLFVDDFLIAQTTLARRFHPATFHPASPIIKPDRSWEGTVAMTYSDGVWYDPADRLFKMWYYSGNPKGICYATSRDGLHWTKPELDVKRGTNRVYSGRRDSTTVWLDLQTANPAERFKLLRPGKGGSPHAEEWGYYHSVSPDGIRWTQLKYRTGPIGDRSTAFWNPFRQVWVYSIRNASGWGNRQMPRHREYWESDQWAAGPTWNSRSRPVLWAWADELDLPDPDLPVRTQLYNLDTVAYESLLLGLFTIWRGDPEKEIPRGRPKRNDICLGFSRDGFHWSRPVRKPFYGYSSDKNDWNWGNVQSAGGGCLIVGDELYFYCSGRRGDMSSTGLAVLRRDGFASMEAGANGGSLLTRPVTFSGAHLFVNLDAPHGELKVEVLDEDGQVLPAFTTEACVPVHGDRTSVAVRWRGQRDLASLAGRPVQFRFHLRRGHLYAFWVSSSEAGESRGYVAAGGPGLTGPIDDNPKH